MMKTTTKNDLIFYAYNESGLSDSDRIQRGIDGDPLIQEEFREIIRALNLMDENLVEPSTESVDKILSFSRTYKG